MVGSEECHHFNNCSLKHILKNEKPRNIELSACVFTRIDFLVFSLGCQATAYTTRFGAQVFGRGLPGFVQLSEKADSKESDAAKKKEKEGEPKKKEEKQGEPKKKEDAPKKTEKEEREALKYFARESVDARAARAYVEFWAREKEEVDALVAARGTRR